MRTDVDIQEVPARFEELVALAEAGQQVVILVNGTARALIAPLTRPFPGLHPGAIVLGPDFNDPLPEDVWPTE